MSKKIGRGHVKFNNGNIKGDMYGGPYTKKPEATHGVCLLEDVPIGCNATIHLPIVDFCLPDKDDLNTAIAQMLLLMKDGKRIYIGCTAGQGRTGTILAIMHRLAVHSYANENGGHFLIHPEYDVIEHVRNVYVPEAVETPEQEAFVEEFDLTEMLTFIKYL
jgi:hypothetical protein